MIKALEGNQSAFGVTSSQVIYLRGINMIMNWHVPVFFMITGVMLLDKNRKLTVSMCVKKYARRVILALLVFGIPFALLEIIFDAGDFSFQMIGQAVVDTLNGDNWDHMWYLYCIVGIYLFLPLFKGFTDRAGRLELRYILALLALYDFFVPAVDSIVGTHIGFAAPITYPVFYLFLGKFLTDEIPLWLRKKAVCAAGLVAIAGVTSAICVLDEGKMGLVTSYTSPVIAVGACFAFSLFKGISVPERWSEALWKVDRLCFGVYLVHPLFINFVYKFLHLTPTRFNAYQLVLIVFFLGFTGVSFFASWVMSLIPPLKKYIL